MHNIVYTGNTRIEDLIHSARGKTLQKQQYLAETTEQLQQFVLQQ
jgi:cation transport regulator ChaC